MKGNACSRCVCMCSELSEVHLPVVPSRSTSRTGIFDRCDSPACTRASRRAQLPAEHRTGVCELAVHKHMDADFVKIMALLPLQYTAITGSRPCYKYSKAAQHGRWWLMRENTTSCVHAQGSMVQISRENHLVFTFLVHACGLCMKAVACALNLLLYLLAV
jgi:hypothetical protein